jgi:uncharacterized protein (TIGR03118 family)
MRTFSVLAAAAALTAALLVAGSAAGGIADDVFTVHNLVSDTPGASATDTTLVNGWGLSAGPTTPWWVSDNGTNASTLYSGVTGAKVPLTVAVPGGPTGTVFNGSATDFVLSQNGKTGAARFLFATESGTILGWSPSVNGTTAIPGVDSSASGAIYKGLATANDRLYATDFHNGRVATFDAAFKPVTTATFSDPKLPKGYAPFGIQALAGSIFVTYAKQDGAKKDEVAGNGLGYVDQFTPDGQLVARVASGGRKNAPPNAPWGLALAPASFGVFSGDILVGNFGNGRVSAYQDRGGGKWVFKGQLRHGDQTIVTIDGLWAIAFGNGSAAGPTTTLYFAAGPGDEAHGLFGSITAG